MSSYVENTGWKDYLRFFPAICHERAGRLLEESWSWRGMEIHVDRVAAPSAPRKLLLIHGGGAYGRVIAPFAAYLETDAEVIIPDLPGYGLSRTNGRVISYDDWVDCLVEVVRRERKRDARAIVAFGGSMGGLLAYAVAARCRLAGLVATCFLDPRNPALRRVASRWPFLNRLGLAIANRFLFLDPIRIPIRWVTKLSRMAKDPALGALCAADPLGGGGKVPLRWLRTFMGSAPPVEPEHFDACPVLLAHPAEDTWTPFALSKPFYHRLRCEKSLVMLEDGSHAPIEPIALCQLNTALTAFLERISAGSAAESRARRPPSCE